jgi:hypothetical protein
MEMQMELQMKMERVKRRQSAPFIRINSLPKVLYTVYKEFPSPHA